jgi:hypothetical protein
MARFLTCCVEPTFADRQISCSARPVWFDESMERAMMVHGEIEQGIRYGLEHDSFAPYLNPDRFAQAGIWL